MTALTENNMLKITAFRVANDASNTALGVVIFQDKRR